MTGMYNNAKTMGGRLCLGKFFLGDDMNIEQKTDLVRSWGFAPLHGENAYFRDTGIAWEEWSPDMPEIIRIMDGRTYEPKSSFWIQWSIWESPTDET